MRNNTRPLLGFLLFSCWVLVVAGCGGGATERTTSPASAVNPWGGSPSNSVSAPTPQPAAPVNVVRGIVQAVPSADEIVVNGFRLNVRDATILANGRATETLKPRVGAVVTVRVGPNNAALSIDLTIALAGPVDSIDQTTSMFSALGQLVMYDEATVFNGTAADTLAPGNMVIVSGYPLGVGHFQATRVDFGGDTYVGGTGLQVMGVTENVDTTAKTFDVGGLAIDYAGVALSVPMRNLQPVVAYANTAPVDNVLTATELFTVAIVWPTTPSDTPPPDPAPTDPAPTDPAPTDPAPTDPAPTDPAPTDPAPTDPAPASMNVNGSIAEMTASDEFIVMGQLVRIVAETVFTGGTVDDLGLDVWVEVVGVLDDQGTLVAGEVMIIPPRNSLIQGHIEAIDELNNVITIFGQDVTVSEGTRFLDLDAPDTPVGISDLFTGSRVIILAAAHDGMIHGVDVFVEDRFDQDTTDVVRLSGAIDLVNQPMLDVLGISVTTDAGTSFRVNGFRVNATAFFSEVAAGQRVRIYGSYANNELAAENIALDVPTP